ncbi:hypothetical protein BDC45DRAFT_504765 [Circinella umbellata]|nr:hypothetical protein BDC45DRAFT_504765 [Circinella umbellata]
MHGNWTSINTLKKAFTFLTLNSVINLDYDYCSTANISEARWEEYIKYNGFSRVCFDNFKLNTVIEKINQHAGRKEEENDIYENVNNQLPEFLFLSCCTALHPIARVKFIHTCSPYLNSSKIHWIVGARCLKLTYFEFFSATFSRLCLKARLSNCARTYKKR